MKMVIITSVFCLSIIMPAAIFAQELTAEPRTNQTDNVGNISLIKIEKPNKPVINDTKEQNPSETANIQLMNNAYASMHIKQKEPSPPATIINSFKSNIHFGGFWNHYAIINFTPDMFVKPFDFISIYASHNTSVYIPISEAKSYIKTLAIKSLAIVAIDNSIRFLLPPNKILQSLAGFAAKNIVMSFLKTTSGGNPALEFKYFYYAVSIRF